MDERCLDTMVKNFHNTVNNPQVLNPTFYFSPEVFTIDEKKIIYIYVPESSQVHRYRSKIYDRVGDADIDDIRDKIFREIAANCLIHREYSHSFPAKFLIFSDRVITENWNKPAGDNPTTIEQLETHTKNPMIARIFKELGWVEELGSGRKNVQKYAPLYYSDYKIAISNEDKFVFSITYRDADEKINEKVNSLETADNQTNKIQRLIDELINDENRPINDEKRNC